jgi:hypothetical protein
MSWFEYTRNDGYSLQCVADPGCLYRIQKSLDCYPPRIPDPTTTTTKEEWEKKFTVLPLVVATNFTKYKIIKFLNT